MKTDEQAMKKAFINRCIEGSVGDGQAEGGAISDLLVADGGDVRLAVDVAPREGLRHRLDGGVLRATTERAHAEQ